MNIREIIFTFDSLQCLYFIKLLVFNLKFLIVIQFSLVIKLSTKLKIVFAENMRNFVYMLLKKYFYSQ